MSLDSLKKSTDALFAKYGKGMIYRVTPADNGDPYDPQPGTPVDYTVEAAPPMEFDQAQRDGTLVQLHDLRVSVAADSLPVEISANPEDAEAVFVIDDVVYQIISVHPVFYGEEVGHYDLQVRK